MSDVGLDASLNLDVRDALDSVGRLEAALRTATEGIVVRLTGDADDIPQVVESAVDAADATVVAEGDAADVTSSIDNAVDAADATVIAEGDAADVTGSIDAAVDAADATVIAEGDAADVTGSIESAVDGADSMVVVTGDASAVTGAVTSAVAGADANVRVTADAQGLSGIRSELQGLERQAETTGRNMTLSVRTAVQATLGVLSGMFIATGVSYNSLIQRTQAAFTTLLGTTEQAQRQLQELTAFASESPFPRQAFIEATQVLLAFGVEAERVVPILGAIQDAVAATGAGSEAIGEITFILAQIQSTGKITAETLNQLGFRGVNAAKLIGDQMGMTEAQIREAITRGSLDAGEALDALVTGMEENFGGAAENVKQTWEGAVDRVKGALRDLSSAIVDPFISKEGGGAAVDFANQLADALRRLEEGIVPVAAALSGSFAGVLDAVGSQLLPAIVEALIAVAPAFGSFTTVITALTPAIEVFAQVLNMIPAPVLQAATMFLLFTRAANAVNSIMGPASAGVSRLAASFTPLNGALIGAAAAFAVYSAAQAQNAASAAQVAAQGRAISDGLRSTEGTVTGLTEALNDLADAGDKVAGPSSGFAQMASTDLGTALREAGITTSEFLDKVREGPAAFEAWRHGLVEAEAITLDSNQALKQLGDQMAEAAETRARMGVETEAWTEAELRAAEATNRTRDGTVDYIGVVEQLEQASQAAIAAEQEHVETLDAQQQALADLAQTAPGVTMLFEAIAAGSDVGASGLGQFALAAEEAGLSGDALEAMAARFGTTGPELAAAIEQVASTITGLRDATLGTLPSLKDIAGAVDEFSLAGFAEELDKAYEAILGFNDNLSLIAEEGGPRLAAAAAQLGPQYTAAIAQGLRDGETDIAAAAELSLEGIENASVDTENLVTGTLGPNLAAATGDMGALAALAFGENYTLDASGNIVLVEGQIAAGIPGVTSASASLGLGGKVGFEGGFTPDPGPGLEGATTGITASAGGISVAGGAAGAAGKAGFETGFKPDPSGGITGARTSITGAAGGIRVAGDTTGTAGKGGFEGGFKPTPTPAMEAVRQLVRQAGPAINRASGDVGQEAVRGFQHGISRFPATGSAAARAAVTSVQGQAGYARGAGYSVGAALGQGIASGISGSIGSIRAAAVNSVRAAVSAARSAGQIDSPSKLFRDLVGVPIAEGIAVGIEAGAADVAAATQGLVTSAADVALGAHQTPAMALSGVGHPGGGDVTVNVHRGAVQITATGDPDYDGRVAADALVGAIPGTMQRARFIARVG